MTIREATEAVAMIQSAWPHRQLSNTTVQVYAHAIADLPLEAVRKAVTRLVQTATFMPSIAEIRAATVQRRMTLPGAEEAWGIVRRAISRVGNYRTPAFDCAEIQGAVGDIGWQALCQSDEGDASSRARFCAAYDARSKRRIEAEVTGGALPDPARVAGLGEGVVAVETGYPTVRQVRGVVAELSGDTEACDGPVAELVAQVLRRSS